MLDEEPEATDLTRAVRAVSTGAPVGEAAFCGYRLLSSRASCTLAGLTWATASWCVPPSTAISTTHQSARSGTTSHTIRSTTSVDSLSSASSSGEPGSTPAASASRAAIFASVRSTSTDRFVGVPPTIGERLAPIPSVGDGIADGPFVAGAVAGGCCAAATLAGGRSAPA